MPPHLRGKPGSGEERPPPEPRREDFDRGGRSGNFLLKFETSMLQGGVILSWVSQRYMRQRLVTDINPLKEQITQNLNLRNEKSK